MSNYFTVWPFVKDCHNSCLKLYFQVPGLVCNSSQHKAYNIICKYGILNRTKLTTPIFLPATLRICCTSFHDIFVCCSQNPFKGISIVVNLRWWLFSSHCHQDSTLSLSCERKSFESFNEIPLCTGSFYSSDINRAFVSETKWLFLCW